MISPFAGTLTPFGRPATGPSAAPGPPTTDLILRLRAGALTGLADGDPIPVWPDGSAAADDATPPTSGTRPIYKTGIVNGKSVVRLAGSQRLTLATPIDSNTPLTIFAVCRPASGGALGLLGGAGDSFLYRISGLHQQILSAFVAMLAGGSATLSTAAFSLIGCSFVSPAYSFRSNGSPDGSGSSAYTFTQPITTVGDDGDAGEPFVGDLAELLVYARGPAADDALAEAYLNGEYALF